MQIKRYAKWTTEQVQAAYRMRGLGLSDAKIGIALGRTLDSVTSRLSARNGYGRPPAKHSPRAIIAKTEVPAFYALGWRLASFVNGAIIFEWPTDDPPLYPKQALQEAA